MKILELLRDFFPVLLKGLGVTLELTAAGLVIASLIGILCGLINVSKKKLPRFIANTYINIIRGTPFLVQAYIIYFGIPIALNLRMGEMTAGILALSLNAGAYMAEIVRAGIESVDRGQMEAARSLGLPYMKAMRKVVLPQALRTMMPSIINQFIITLKDTSILSVMGIRELTLNGKIIIGNNMESMRIWFLVALFYFIVIMALTRISKYMERRASYGR